MGSRGLVKLSRFGLVWQAGGGRRIDDMQQTAAVASAAQSGGNSEGAVTVARLGQVGACLVCGVVASGPLARGGGALDVRNGLVWSGVRRLLFGVAAASWMFVAEGCAIGAWLGAALGGG